MFFPIVQRALLREILAIFFAVITVLLAIILGFRLSRLLAAAVDGSMSLLAVWKLIGLQAINIAVILMPIALIVAMMMSLARLYRSQEVTAILSAGCGRLTIARFLFLPTVLIASLVLVLSLFLLPNTYLQIATLRATAEQEAGFAMMSEESFRSVSPQLHLHTGKSEQGGWQDFFIAQDKDGEKSLVFADFGKVISRDGEQFLQLNQGIRVAWKELSAANFSNREDYLKGFYQGVNYTQFAAGELHLPSSNASNQERRLRNVASFELGASAPERAELQKRLNPALALLIFVFALPLIAHTRPRSSAQRILPAFLLFALYLNVLDWAVKVAAKGKISLFVSGFAVHLAAIILILFFWLRAQRQAKP